MKNTKLRAKRETSGKTQAQIAKESGICESQYQNIEYGKSKPGIETAIQIARAVGIKTLDEFFDVFGAATPNEKPAASG